jgi:FAD/FMN-containing dehydrogenase
VNFSLQKLSGWGRFPAQECAVVRPERYRELQPVSESVIARGQGRSYGDAALNENGTVVLTQRINRFLELDVERGLLRAEAGLTLAEAIAAIVPHGWFLPVVTGTRHVSLGGCVAADVHGKNHHRVGSFASAVQGFEIFLADGQRLRCSAHDHPGLFWATLGGMGLTGTIGEVTLRLQRIPSAWMVTRHRDAGNLEMLFRDFEDSACDDEYSVAWLDGLARGSALGRGVLMTAHHAAVDELPARHRQTPLHYQTPPARRVKFDFPSWALNPVTVGLFNRMYRWVQSGKHSGEITSCLDYFFPLDSLADWNRIYGRRGFLQYQCVLPRARAYEGMRALLERISDSRRASFLAVLKRFGPGNAGYLSFPMEGYTLAMDFPLRDPGLFGLLDILDEIVVQHGGRVYLAKDARLQPDVFRRMYPRYAEWLAVKQQADPGNRFSSSLARRLHIGANP